MRISKRREGDISAVSNELEFFLHNTTAQNVLHRNTELELTPEVNQVHAIELMVSMAQDSDALRSMIPAAIQTLQTLVETTGGQMYAGSSLLKDTSQNTPSWYRTTSLSRKLAHGFLTMGSQQLVLGIAKEGKGRIAGEQFGMNLYSFLRQLTPLLLSMTATSPGTYVQGQATNTGLESFRPAQYAVMSSNLPPSMMATPPLGSLQEYFAHLQRVSNEVLTRLDNNQLDANRAELFRQRDSGAYAPFETLEPHQIYSWVRIRPDHANADSAFSLELRAMDISNRVETITAINTFIIGLAYYASQHGFETLQNLVAPLDIRAADIYPTLLRVARTGLETPVGGNQRQRPLRELIPPLIAYSSEGLRNRNQDSKAMETELMRIYQQGNDAQHWQRELQQPQNAHAMERALIAHLAQSLKNH